MENIDLVSVLLEGVAVVISLALAIGKKQAYGWGFALTFLIYIFYDLARMRAWQISDTLLTTGFLIATLSAVLSLYCIYKKQN